MENMLGNTLGTWATYWEPIENLKEHIGNERKMKKKILLALSKALGEHLIAI
jgi:hypothetical protein